MEPTTVVIDNGTGYTKMGYAGNMEPSYLVPSMIATSINMGKPQKSTMNNPSFRTPELDFMIGEEAQNADARKYDIKYILSKGQICDWEGIEKYWHKSIHQYLRCDPEDHRFILTEPPMNTPQNREQIAEIMFETFNVKGLFIGVQAALALYAQVCKTNQSDQNQGLTENDMTGTVIDAGDGVTHIFPVCDSYVIGSCVKSIPLAGRDMTSYIVQSFKDRNEKCTNDQAAKIKEKYGYVCQDMQKEFAKFDKKKTDDKGNAIQSNKFKRYVHKMANGNMVPMDVGYESFLAPEMFFHPEFVHKDYTKPLDMVVDDAIQSCPVEYRIKLYNNIVLSGGSTLFKGFDERLQKTLQKRIDSFLQVQQEKIGPDEKLDPITCEVSQNIVQRYAVWFGGSVLGSQEYFPSVCKSREQYAEYGPAICRHNAIFQQ